MSDTIEIQNLTCKVIKDFPEYAVTKCGKIFRIKSGKQIKLCPDGRGYLFFTACIKNKKSNVRVHRCVGSEWLEPVEGKDLINHKDANKVNNHYSNLEWCNYTENNHHAYREGLYGIGQDHHRSKLTDDQVHIICQRLEDGWRIVDISKDLEIPKHLIKNIKYGQTYTHISQFYNLQKILNSNKKDIGESTVRWICSELVRGVSMKDIVSKSGNSNVTMYYVKGIRDKIIYKIISDEYF